MRGTASLRLTAWVSIGLGLFFLASYGVIARGVMGHRARFVRVDGVITASSFTPGTAERPNSCRRTFRWTYQLDGRTHESEVWNQSPRQHPCERLQAHIAAHPVGLQVQGFHDTQGEREGFLYPDANHDIVTGPLIGGYLLLFGFYTLSLFSQFGRVPTLRRYGQWYHLRVAHSHASRATYWGLAAIWTALAFSVMLNWRQRYGLDPNAWRVGTLVGLTCFGVCLVIWLLLSARSRAYVEATLAIDQPSLRPGQPIAIRVAQPFQGTVRVRQLELELACRVVRRGLKGSPREHILASLREVHLVERDFGPASKLETTITMTVPDDPAVEAATAEKPYWLLLYKVDGVGIADADSIYPIPAEQTGKARR